MTSTKKGGGVITKFWVILQMVVDGVLEGGFLTLLTSTNPKSKFLPFPCKQNESISHEAIIRAAVAHSNKEILTKLRIKKGAY